jgi:phosphoribosylamine---glycine ligase
MHILLLGSGGREHALAIQLAASKQCTQLFIAPGNAGTMQCGTNIALSVNDFEGIQNFCINNNIDMIIVGPEDPLVNGLRNIFENNATLKHVIFVGPDKLGAQLEGSKDFSKKFMQKYNIPTASYATFTKENYNEGVSYIKQHTLPIVLKADGLAAGKGVIIAQSQQVALDSFEQMIQHAQFGNASTKVVIEQFLTGIELSVFALCDGKNYLLLPNAKDYKRIGEKDLGLNTGGMGAISPVPFANEAFMQKVIHKIVEPTINGLITENIDYKGFIFFGLINVEDNPYVIEYNCRLGDPETEVVLPRIKSDLVELFVAMHKQNLNKTNIDISKEHACTIMCVSGGYPEKYTNGYEISGLNNIENSTVFHAGTTLKDNKVISNGGRVLSITSLANNLAQAIETSNRNAKNISFTDMYYRRDIGYEFIN